MKTEKIEIWVDDSFYSKATQKVINTRSCMFNTIKVGEFKNKVTLEIEMPEREG